MTMGESRQELLAWLNDLLQLNYNKVEQVGTGAALCQIFDSIYGDVQLSKVKFSTPHEYEYVNNFKVLQKTFTDHQVDRYIPVDRLIKCKFQDNLEFLQWVKKHWDTFYPGGEYDAVGRRKGGSSGSRGAVNKRSNSNLTTTKSAAAPPRSMAAATKQGPISRARVPAASTKAAPVANDALINDLTQQMTGLQVTVDGLEKERDFYFSKLRDVEVMVQNCVDAEGNGEELIQFCKEIQTILYSTEEGFEIPNDVQPTLVDEETY